MSNLLNELTTEQVNPRTSNIDCLTTEEIVRLINDEDRQIAYKIQELTPVIAKAADYIIHSFQNGGRLLYLGAGTSGRLGILDASECPPTYGTDPSMVQGIIAGGDRAIKDPVEGAEDSPFTGAADIDALNVGPNDTVVGIAASGRTPYVLGAMKRARELGATVIGLCNNHDTPMSGYADLLIEAVVGPEVVLGSTRMKAGTAQKLILNMLTTSAMIRMGKVYGNLMV
ncbi:MAG: murQ, partial [Paenibacillus sp.]|nr:murQ [Paenibacillus sp.]